MSSRFAAVSSVAAFLVLSVGALTYEFHERPTYRVGPQADGSAVVPTNQRVTPAGTQVTFSGRPLAIAVRPDQKTAAVLNTGSGQSNVATSPIIIVDLASGMVRTGGRSASTASTRLRSWVRRGNSARGQTGTPTR